MAELVEQAAQQRRQRPQMVGNHRRGRSADARQVEPDDLAPRVERVNERLQQLKAGPDAVAQQQRRPLAQLMNSAIAMNWQVAAAQT
jgi:hypothetical protein